VVAAELGHQVATTGRAALVEDAVTA